MKIGRITSTNDSFIELILDVFMTIYEKLFTDYLLENEHLPDGGKFNVRPEITLKANQIDLKVKNKSFLKKYRMHKQSMLFNCWGGTLMYFGVISAPVWIEPQQMEFWLKTNTIKTPVPHLNCIVVLRDSEQKLIHTAVYLGNNLCWHKIGRNRAAIMSLDQIKKNYFETKYVDFVRIIS